MAGFFVLALAAVLIWLFAESKMTRIVGFGILGTIAVLAAGYLFWRESQNSVQRPPSEMAKPQTPPDAKTVEESFTVLSPADVALPRVSLQSGVETYSGIDGKQYERPDLRSWTLLGDVKNLSKTHRVRDVILNVRLYSCPSYYSTPVNEVKYEDLSLICSKIGERSLGLYDLKLDPGAAKSFTQDFRFLNQGNALNWRYWVEVTRVVAQI
jgi:hypothetical protein